MNLRKDIYFGLQRAIGSHAGVYYREFLQWERGSAQWARRQAELRLKRLIADAVTKVPFYRRYSVDPNTELESFPILTKDMLRDEFPHFMVESLAKQFAANSSRTTYSWCRVQSGGSTGNPVTVIHDREYRDRGRAARLYGQFLSGIAIGTPYLRLWGSMADINQSRTSWLHRFDSYMRRETLLNAFRMRESDMAGYVRIINESPAAHLVAYADAAFEIANYCLEQRVTAKKLKSIMACAGTVTPEIRRALMTVFDARVHNWYGSRECGGIACECEQGGLHILTNNVKLEIVDSSGSSLPPGRIGRVLITLLSNLHFPLVRYEIGDIAALSADACSCGRPFPVLDHIEGRSLEALHASDGAYVSPVYVRHLIGVVHNSGVIKRFQLIQNSLTHFDLKIETVADCTIEKFSQTMQRIVRDLRAVFGEAAAIDVARVPEIPCTASGKFLYTISRLRHNIS